MAITFQPPQLSRSKRNADVRFRVSLTVPYSEKEAVKKLGGRWDPEKKSWYVIIDSSKSIITYQRWLTSPIID